MEKPVVLKVVHSKITYVTEGPNIGRPCIAIEIDNKAGEDVTISDLRANVALDLKGQEQKIVSIYGDVVKSQKDVIAFGHHLAQFHPEMTLEVMWDAKVQPRSELFPFVDVWKLVMPSTLKGISVKLFQDVQSFAPYSCGLIEVRSKAGATKLVEWCKAYNINQDRILATVSEKYTNGVRDMVKKGIRIQQTLKV